VEKINLQIDPELGIELKKYIDSGLVITGMDMIKGWKGASDSYFISLGEKPVVFPVVPISPFGTSAALPYVKAKQPDDPEAVEKAEPFNYKKPIVASHSSDPSKPTLCDLVDRIIKSNKDAGMFGKGLADKCLADCVELKDPMTKTSFPTEVQNAMQAYLNQELSK